MEHAEVVEEVEVAKGAVVAEEVGVVDEVEFAVEDDHQEEVPEVALEAEETEEVVPKVALEEQQEEQVATPSKEPAPNTFRPLTVRQQKLMHRPCQSRAAKSVKEPGIETPKEAVRQTKPVGKAVEKV